MNYKDDQLKATQAIKQARSLHDSKYITGKDVEGNDQIRAVTLSLGIKQFKRNNPKISKSLLKTYKQNAWNGYIDN